MFATYLPICCSPSNLWRLLLAMLPTCNLSVVLLVNHKIPIVLVGWLGVHPTKSHTFYGTVRAQTVSSLSRPFNTGYRVKYPLFAQFLALCRDRRVTIPTICMGSLHSITTPMCIVGIVITWARHSAKIRLKSLIVLTKNYFNHRAPMQWNGSFYSTSVLFTRLL
jgi:hypothetical protein